MLASDSDIPPARMSRPANGQNEITLDSVDHVQSVYGVSSRIVLTCMLRDKENVTVSQICERKMKIVITHSHI